MARVVKDVLAGEQVVASSFVLDSGIEVAHVGGEVAEGDCEAQPMSWGQTAGNAPEGNMKFADLSWRRR